MTKEGLESVYYLKRELKMWQQRRQQMEEDLIPAGQQIQGLVTTKNAEQSVTEQKALSLMECAEMIGNRIGNLQQLIYESEEYIFSLEDPRLRVILELRCIQCQSWKNIAKYLGEGFTSEMVRQIYHRFMADKKEGGNGDN